MTEKIYASFEVGNSAWKFLVLKIDKEKINILYNKIDSSNNLIKDNKVINARRIAEIIENEVSNANLALGLVINKIIYIIPSHDLKIIDAKTNLKFNTPHVVNETDIKNLKNKVQKYSVDYDNDFKLIEASNDSYILDKSNTFNKEPLGENCKSIHLKSKLYYIPEEVYENFTEPFKYTTKVSILFVVLDIFATSYSLSKYVEEDNHDFIAVDYGHNSTKIIYMNNRIVQRVISLKLGGYNLDKDMNYYLNMLNKKQNPGNIVSKTPLSELLLHQHHLKYSDIDDVTGNKVIYPLDFTSKEITHVIESRIHESLSQVFSQINNIRENDCPIILSGGVTRFYMFKKIINKYFDKYQSIIYSKETSRNNASFTNVIGAAIYLHIYNLENNKNLSSVKVNLGFSSTHKLNLRNLCKNKFFKLVKLSKQ